MRMLTIAAAMGMSSMCLASEFSVDVNHPKADDSGPGGRAAPFKTIARAMRDAKPGDVITVMPGVYRERVEVKASGTAQAPILLQGADRDRVVLLGTDRLEGWERLGADAARPLWVKRDWRRAWCGWRKDMAHGAKPPTGRCEQVVCDGKLLEHVLSLDEMKPGTFYADPRGEKILAVWLPDGKGPADHELDAATRDTLLMLSGSHLHVRRLTLRYAANRAQLGALQVRGKHNVAEDIVVEWTNGNGVGLGGHANRLRRVISRFNGQLGMGGGGTDAVVEDCEVSDNNQKGFSAGWEAGGIKVCLARNMRIIRMRAMRNRGPGIWFDIDDRGGLIQGCHCADNENSGIFIEISRGIVIADNLCVGNGGAAAFKAGWADAGICLAESRDCQVIHNTCVGNRTGIAMREMSPRKFKGIDKEEVSYFTGGHVIERNICAFDYWSFGYWADNPFFGPHPSKSVGMRGTALDPAQMKLKIDHNVYWPREKRPVALWGVPWRPKHKVFKALQGFSELAGHDTHTLAADPLFADAENRDFRLDAHSPARKLGAGVRREWEWLLSPAQRSGRGE